MRKGSSYVLVTVLLAASPALLLAQGNNSATKASQSSRVVIEKADEALSKKITYEGANLPLEKILGDVTQQGGVKFTPSSSADNWQARERTAVVFLQDASLSDFKSGIAKLFDYQWTKIDDGEKKRYVLKESRHARLIRESALNVRDQKNTKLRVEAISSALDAAEKATSLTSIELKEAKDSDPWLYFLSENPSGRAWAELLRKLPVEVWEGVAAGESQNINLADSSMQNLITQIRDLPMTGTSSITNNDWGGENRRLPIYEASVGSVNNPDGGIAAYIYVWTLKTELKNGYESMSHQMIEMFPVGKSKCFNCMADGFSSQNIDKGMRWIDAKNAGLQKVCDMPGTSTQAITEKPEVDKALLREIEHKPVEDKNKKKENGMIRHLRGLSHETGFTIMVETFEDARTEFWAVPEKGTIKDILDAIAGPDLTYERSGNTILLRYKDWPERRALELPNALVDRWEKLAKAHDGLMFDDLYEIVQNANYEQITKTLKRNPILDYATKNEMIFFGTYSYIKVLAMLPDEDSRRLYRSDTGLPIGKIKELNLQGEEMKPVVHWIDRISAKDQNASMGLKVTERPTEQSIYRLEISPFIRYSNGEVEQPTFGLLGPSSVREFREFVKSVEKERATAQKT